MARKALITIQNEFEKNDGSDTSVIPGLSEAESVEAYVIASCYVAAVSVAALHPKEMGSLCEEHKTDILQVITAQFYNFMPTAFSLAKDILKSKEFTSQVREAADRLAQELN